MKIKLLLVGKTVEQYLQKGIDVYQGRMKYYISFERIEIPELKQVSSLSKDQIKVKEGELLLKQIKIQDCVVLLDEKGKTYSSVDWARHLEQVIAHSSRDIVFVIGGGYGFSEQVYSRADSMLSLSNMTFSHQLVRLIFMEQLYRAFTIIKGEPYHHE
ncbi:MAG: 23S rRNA (pseudouridine(1915)-N(3))-methyltransferase RlmH [Bacteroidales bacterium]|nr:23S rRNA (pseudouridine(1915)-N(3))-methyltransferase RlmH [Bacteroidales bacterium]MDD4669621.1 23S rRNA (pseudouridine(1915)-N(3))-methyltransferase RlmH [Bacteroidales bacterium]